ncbi:hypothetical protein PUR61_32070 [Streptomyces sp. BE20]|uniref:hypothetical protein n=1 Tax=Streptomyces sp. BE20 TaxID=3002525 RepID=UPI002E7614ED|nr:hypothetical protein [Streptomyces sp. BE20]MEE1826787.1 hypothetical protein [Streptomyces sp. BE20]
MTEPDERQGDPVVPAPRSARHAAPRTPVRIRLRGRALAMAAVPTALLMAAAYTPGSAIAETSASKPCATAPDAAPLPPKVAETPVPKSELPPPIPGPSVPLPEATAPVTPPASGPATAPTAVPTPAVPTPAVPTPAVPPTAAPTTAAPSAPRPPAATPPPAATAGTAGGATRAGLIDDIVGGVIDLVRPGGAPSPTAAPSAGVHAVAPAAPAPSPTGPAPTAPAPTATAPAPVTPSGTASGVPSSTPSGAPSGSASAKPAAKPSTKPTAGSSAGSGASSSPSAPARSSAPGTPTPSGPASATPTKDPNCLVDTKALNPAGKPPDNPILVPDQNWTLQTSRLVLNHAVLLGVVNVQTPTGTKRVLKFEVESVDIENLHMSTLEGNDKTFHVKGAPGSVSTMRSGTVTMYVERLSGHLSKVLGLPIPIDLGELTLTPDGPLPQWLYDLIGQLQLPLWLELTGVTAVQAGQFGGTLTIPGMQLYNDDTPYVGNAK